MLITKVRFSKLWHAKLRIAKVRLQNYNLIKCEFLNCDLQNCEFQQCVCWHFQLNMFDNCTIVDYSKIICHIAINTLKFASFGSAICSVQFAK